MSQVGPISVDPAGLVDMAGRIEQVAAHLAAAKATFDGYDAALRSDRIEDALHDFNAAWSDKRKELHNGLVEAAGVLRNAADQFCAADSDLAKQITGDSQ